MGRVTLPLAGSIELADKTREQAADAVVAALAPFYSNLSVTVGVDRYTSNRILLLGAGGAAGRVEFRPATDLAGSADQGRGAKRRRVALRVAAAALVAAGVEAVTAAAAGGGLVIYRSVWRSIGAATRWCGVNVKAMLTGGGGMADLRLKRDDVVYVPSPADNYISVLGQVNHPGALELDSTTTLAKLIAESGGLTVQAGKSPDLRVYQTATGVTRVIPFKSVLGPGKVDLTLHSGDVVLVTESGFNQASYVLQQLSPLVTIFTAAAFFNR